MRNNFDAAHDLRNIVLDKELCAMVCATVKFRRSDISKIANETASNIVDKFGNVTLLFGFKKGCEALVDKAMVVLLATRSLAPVICTLVNMHVAA